MTIWEALQYVGTGLSLVAFVVAAILLAYRARLTQRAEIIKSAPEEERVEAIAVTAEFFRVDVTRLTRAQQQDIVLAQIYARARRDLLLAVVSLGVAVMLAAIAMTAIWTSKPPGTVTACEEPTRVADEALLSKFPNADKLRQQYFRALCIYVLSEAKLSPEQKAQYLIQLTLDDPFAAQAKQQAIDAINLGDYRRAEVLSTAALNQIIAVQLIGDGHPDLAIGNLQQSERLLDGIHTENSARDRVQRGFNYKTYAQVFAEKGNLEQEQRYLDLALKTFEQVKDDPNLSGKTTNEFVGAIHGIANVHLMRHQYRESIELDKLVTSLAPGYAYAWHDMFLAYFDLAKQGDIDLRNMRNALEKTKQTGAQWPGLDAKQFALMDSMLAQFEQQ